MRLAIPWLPHLSLVGNAGPALGLDTAEKLNVEPDFGWRKPFIAYG